MKLRAPNYAEVASTLALTLALGTGGAYAAEMITGKDIAKNAVTSKHLKNGTVKEKDLNSKVAAKLNATTGSPGLTGATGPAGPKGATGSRGFSAWDTIPSAVTVRGQEYARLWGNGGVINVSLPAAAPSALTNETVNFAGTSPTSGDDDATCTGTYANPTAPAGKVCLYPDNVENSFGDATMANGWTWGDAALRTRAFYVEYGGAPTDVDYVWFTWAYTAP